MPLCRAAIDKGAWRIALVFYEEGRFEPSGFVHARCAPAYFETANVLPRVRRFSRGLREEDLAELEADLDRPPPPRPDRGARDRRRARRLLRDGLGHGRPDESPPHPVTVRAFRLGRTPVTHAQYARFVEEGGSPEPPWWRDPAFDAPDQPVVGVTWFEAAAYARWLADALGGAWRLPTEAEWERAARGGLAGADTAWGDALPPDEIPQGPLAGPWPAGRGRPNGYGLLDMGTIVHEWCLDWYGADS